MVKEYKPPQIVKQRVIPKKNQKAHRVLGIAVAFVSILMFFVASAIGTILYQFEEISKEKIYPGVSVDSISFGGKTADQVEKYFAQKSEPFQQLLFHFSYEDHIATLSGKDLSVVFDGKLSGAQAYSIGRSGNVLSDVYQKWRAISSGVNLTSVLSMRLEALDELLTNLSTNIDVAPQDALFQFENGKVLSFRQAKDGKKLQKEKIKESVIGTIKSYTTTTPQTSSPIRLELPVEIVHPAITTEGSNQYGIQDLLGTGVSKFAGSIPGRIHNIELAASRIHGHLVPPGQVFSFNDTLGDVSGTTGFAPAYIIKDGRTVLGDGGGVCQVSTTLFRAALKAGLPIAERHAHAYRVGYYEQESPPGLDATVYSPSYDLKIKNDTPGYILIQMKIDKTNPTLSFAIYGTHDGRQAETTNPVILSQTPPPPDLFQDDPTIQKGVVKQVDWKAWGAKVTFDYKVVRNGEEIEKQTFFSNFRPWQAVFLKGTKEG